jgi:hypothetical protein
MTVFDVKSPSQYGAAMLAKCTVIVLVPLLVQTTVTLSLPEVGTNVPPVICHIHMVPGAWNAA